MSRKKETLTLSIPSGTKAQLDALADRCGYYWGKSPSPSALVTAIAQGELRVGADITLSQPQVHSLQQAVGDLIDAGHIEEAKSVITLLLDFGHLAPPLRQRLMQQVSLPTEGWRLQLDQLIQAQQPFHLVYGKPSGNLSEFTVRYAELVPYEKRLYLQLWCEELSHRPGIAALQHNRSLRLDRIQGVVPVTGQWRGQLDTLAVELQLQGGLIHGYASRPEDIEDVMAADARRIVRQVSNPFWFFREVRRYGPDCIVVGPAEVRDRFAEEIARLYHHYFPEVQL
ncbi:MAG: WYL domain-containing protein [Cyanobacteria bacterium]|nr:WYL domain-containing protein [Cyanobacteriota bacterium]MDA0867368.1 WYL domain-containing protein [Cyanobacteriota bacterium]